MRRGWKIVLGSLLALTVYLTAESLLPVSAQPSAQVSIALIHAYQATGSKLMHSSGVNCRYQPTCSHYAADAIGYYGTASGMVRAAGRIWRCSPWGGSGYDPAVEERPAAYVAPQQETPEERKAREESQRKDFKKEVNKVFKDNEKEAAAAAATCGVTCILGIIAGIVYLIVKIFFMVWAFKDATARGDSNAILWPILIFFFSIIGLVIYLAVRPKGDFSPCPSCHKPRLSTLAKCPHCSVDSSAPPKTT